MGKKLRKDGEGELGKNGEGRRRCADESFHQGRPHLHEAWRRRLAGVEETAFTLRARLEERGKRENEGKNGNSSIVLSMRLNPWEKSDFFSRLVP
jgi:hypothetical protein